MERLIGIPLETALNGMPGLEDLRSTSIAGLNDIKCVFNYGTDYWKARQEVINRIGMVSNLPAGDRARALALEPDRRDRPLRARGAGLHAEPAQGGAGLGAQAALQDRPRRDRRDGLRRDGQAVSGPARHPAPAAIQRDPAAGRGRDLASRTPTSAATSCRWGSSRTTSGRSATWARGSIRSTRPAADRAYSIEVEKLEDIQDVVVTSYQGMPVYIRQIAKVVVGHRPRLGGRGTANRTRTSRRGHRADAEVREVAADVRGRAGQDQTRSRTSISFPRG